MTIVHKAWNIHKNSDGLDRLALPNKPDNPAYFTANAEPRIPIEGINITDVGTEFFDEGKIRIAIFLSLSLKKIEIFSFS
ncbi:hypothetical protein O181_009550 [Austropuccinia psidii MF-1]|uniref:Uncharacterized protein n=1 Tax=Austropuccinia psidii MF-1 TaxID=1389203 RepID=A0A9Q3BRH7_9BASI|nr:hypothetical protein [Austropuccinia psidii MF-1]